VRKQYSEETLSRQVTTETAPLHASPALRAWGQLLRGHAATTRLLSAELQEHDLTINDYEALLLLAEAEDSRLKRVELAQRLVLTPSGVTRLLEGLEAAGLVERAACPADLRIVYAQLTERGRERLSVASCGHVGSVRALFEEYFSADELETLASLLERLPGGDDLCPAKSV
jgi:DNA-binding MarR family transcriptional regulator